MEMHNLYKYLWGKDSSLRDRIYSPYVCDDGGISQLCMLSLPLDDDREEDGEDAAMSERAFLNLPCNLRRLLVRDSYKGALRMMEDSEASRTPEMGYITKRKDDGTPYTASRPIKGSRQKADKAFVFTGHPGIGKTCFLSCVLVERLLKAQPTVLQFGGDSDEYSHFPFDKLGVRPVLSCDDDSLKDSTIWALTDQNLAALHPLLTATSGLSLSRHHRDGRTTKRSRNTTRPRCTICLSGHGRRLRPLRQFPSS